MKSWGLLALVLLAGCATMPDRAIPAGARYVALGSSFAAGAGIGPNQPGSPARCARSVNNYPSLLAARLSLTLSDATCSGATTAHVLGPWNDLAPQIDALTADTRLVTITIGGNDLGYVGMLFARSCDPAVGLLLGARSLPCPPRDAAMPDAAGYARAKAAMRQIATEVSTRAPRATLVFVQYVTLAPNKPCPASGLSPADAAAAAMLGRRLAAITAEVARDSGALLLAADVSSRRRTPCDRDPWAKGRSLPGEQSGGAPWHPNAAGHAAIAAQLAALLR